MTRSRGAVSAYGVAAEKSLSGREVTGQSNVYLNPLPRHMVLRYRPKSRASPWGYAGSTTTQPE
jgi:hypothetical protein